MKIGATGAVGLCEAVVCGPVHLVSTTTHLSGVQSRTRAGLRGMGGCLSGRGHTAGGYNVDRRGGRRDDAAATTTSTAGEAGRAEVAELDDVVDVWQLSAVPIRLLTGA